MRINRIIEKTYAEGQGCRFCIWVQGCPHKCDGCFATELWDFHRGYDISTDEVISKINLAEKDICGITFLGGEPFEYSKELSIIANYIHSINKNVITFTGYTYEQLLNKPENDLLLSQTDLLIDGKFEKSWLDENGINSEEIESKIDEVLLSYAERYATKAENAFQKQDVNTAIDNIEVAIELQPNNGDYQNKLTEYEEYIPYSLYLEDNCLNIDETGDFWGSS